MTPPLAFAYTAYDKGQLWSKSTSMDFESESMDFHIHFFFLPCDPWGAPQLRIESIWK